MADRDAFRGSMRPGYDQAVSHIQDCDAVAAVAEIGHAVVRDVKAALRHHPMVWSEHHNVIAGLLGCAEPDMYVIERLPHAHGKTSEVLRRSMLVLTIAIQFRGKQFTSTKHALFLTWLIELAEYELLARLEITSKSGEERSTDCMVQTANEVRILLRDAFERLSEQCDAGDDIDRLTWKKPERATPDKNRAGIAGIQGVIVPMRRPERHPKKGKGDSRG